MCVCVCVCVFPHRGRGATYTLEATRLQAGLEEGLAALLGDAGLEPLALGGHGHAPSIQRGGGSGGGEGAKGGHGNAEEREAHLGQVSKRTVS